MGPGNRPSRRWLAVIAAAVLAVTSGGLAVLSAGPASAATVFPLKVTGSHRYLLDANNQPFYWAADTAWFMLQSATQEEWDLYLDNRKAKGFTGVMVVAPQMFNEKNRYGELPFTTPGHLSTLDERWWARIDLFVSKAHARGLAVNMALLWLGYQNEGWGVAYGYNTVAQSRTFGQVMGKRYGAGTPRPERDLPTRW